VRKFWYSLGISVFPPFLESRGFPRDVPITCLLFYMQGSLSQLFFLLRRDQFLFFPRFLPGTPPFRPLPSTPTTRTPGVPAPLPPSSPSICSHTPPWALAFKHLCREREHHPLFQSLNLCSQETPLMSWITSSFRFSRT